MTGSARSPPSTPIGTSAIGGAIARSFLFPRAFPPSLRFTTLLCSLICLHLLPDRVPVSRQLRVAKFCSSTLCSFLADFPAANLFPTGSASPSPRLHHFESLSPPSDLFPFHGHSINFLAFSKRRPRILQSSLFPPPVLRLPQKELWPSARSSRTPTSETHPGEFSAGLLDHAAQTSQLLDPLLMHIYFLGSVFSPVSPTPTLLLPLAPPRTSTGAYIHPFLPEPQPSPINALFSVFEAELQDVIPICHATIAGTRIVGRLTAGYV